MTLAHSTVGAFYLLLTLALLLLVPVTALAYTFDQSVLALPQQRTGPSREPCEAPGSSDVTLSPGGNWERTIEQARPGQRFFLTAGTYTTTTLRLPNGTSGARIAVKPVNCAAVTINGRVEPGSYTTLAGMTLSHLTGTHNAFGLAGTVRIGREGTTGVIVRNNFITADDHYAVYVDGGPHAHLTLEGNELRFPARGSGWNVFYVRGAQCAECTFTANKLSSLGMEADLIQMYNWSGQWTIARNTFGGSPREGNHLDIKYATVGTSGNVLTVLENHFDGTHLAPTYGCALDHNASDSGVGPNQYSFTVHAKGNYFHNCPVVVWDHRISVRSAAERADTNSRTLYFTYNRVEMDSDARVGCESNNCYVEHNTFIRGKIKAGSGTVTPQNVVVRGNVLSQTVIENAHKMSSEGGNRPGRPDDEPTLVEAPARPSAPRNLRMLHQ